MASKGLPLQLTGHLSGLVFELLRELTRLARQRRGDDHGLKVGAYSVLATLATVEALSQSEISRRLNLNAGDLVGTIDELEQAGWVARQPDAQDRRRYRVQITAAGRKAVAARSSQIETFDAEAFSALSAQERQRLLKYLTTVLADLRARGDGGNYDPPSEDQWSGALR